MKRFFSLLILVILAIGSGCSNRNNHIFLEPIPKPTAVALNSQSLVKNQLYGHYQEWKSVKYRLGGLSKKGIDCSGFAYLTYRSKFGIDLPRTTEQQAKRGTSVSKNELQTGDLVFFKTGWTVRHVGIYLEDQNFLHASTSNGVMISSLDNIYWKSKYWKAKRIR